MVKILPANAGDVGSIPGSGRPRGEGKGNPLQYIYCIYTNMYKGLIVLLYVEKDYTSFKIRAHSVTSPQLHPICKDLISKQDHMHRFGGKGQLGLEHIFKRDTIKP